MDLEKRFSYKKINAVYDVIISSLNDVEQKELLDLLQSQEEENDENDTD